MADTVSYIVIPPGAKGNHTKTWFVAEMDEWLDHLLNMDTGEAGSITYDVVPTEPEAIAYCDQLNRQGSI